MNSLLAVVDRVEEDGPTTKEVRRDLIYRHINRVIGEIRRTAGVKLTAEQILAVENVLWCEFSTFYPIPMPKGVKKNA